MNNNNVVLRRCEDNLYVSGWGVVIMGIWSVLRPIIQFMLGSSVFSDLKSKTKNSPAAAIVIVGIFVALIMIAVLGLHLYTGLNAIKAAKGKNHKKGYLITAIITLCISLLSLIAYKDSLSITESIATLIASILVDLTTIYIFITLIVSTVKIRKIKKEQEAA